MTRAQKRRATRGRQVLRWMALAFLAYQLAGGWVLDHVCPQIRAPWRYRQQARLDALATPPTILCLGSSRFGCCLDENILTAALRQVSGERAVGVVNASIPGGDALSAERLLEHALERGRPEVVVLEVVPTSVTHRNPWTEIFVTQELTWSQLPTHLPDILRSSNLVQHRLLPLYAYRLQICKQTSEAMRQWWQGPSLAAAPSSGAGGDLRADWDRALGEKLPPRSTRNLNLEAAKPSLVKDLRDFRPGGVLAAGIERLLERCHDQGIEVLLVSPPLASIHRGLHTAAIEEPFRAYMAELCQRFGCRWVDCRWDLADEDFLDHHHADASGRVRFSRQLATEVLAPCWLALRQPSGAPPAITGVGTSQPAGGR